MKIWIDGQLKTPKQAQISVQSHALHYGTAAFEGIRFYDTSEGPAIFRLTEHLDRLHNSARALGMEKNQLLSRKKLAEAITETVQANKISSGYIRPIIFYGTGALGLPTNKNEVQTAVIVLPWKDYLDKSGIALATAETRRIDGRVFRPEAKISGTYVNSLLALNEAHAKKADEALLLDLDGYVAEGSAENLFFVKNNKIRTPTPGAILPGITRETIMTLARDLGYEVKEKRCKLDEFKNADEVFMVGTAAEVTPVAKIDGQKIGSGKQGQVSKQLDDLYNKVVRGTAAQKYRKWLRFIPEH